MIKTNPVSLSILNLSLNIPLANIAVQTYVIDVKGNTTE